MPVARVTKIWIDQSSVPTHFHIQFSANNGTSYTPFSTTQASPAAPEDLAVATLDADGYYTIDGINSPSGNEAAASYAGNLYQTQVKVGANWSTWADAFPAGYVPLLAGYAQYPTAADLELYLEAAGLTISTVLATQLPGAISASIRQVERATGRKFVAATGTKTFNPPTNPGSVLEIPDVVSLSAVVYQPLGGTAETLVAATDYRLERLGGYWEGPYDSLRLLRQWSYLSYPYRGSLSLTGSWGYGSVPEDVWQAMLSGAAHQLAPQIVHGITGGVVSWKDDERSVEYGPKPLAGLFGEWKSRVDGAVGRWKRIALG